jgi:hypothetical protein
MVKNNRYKDTPYASQYKNFKRTRLSENCEINAVYKEKKMRKSKYLVQTMETDPLKIKKLKEGPKL